MHLHPCSTPSCPKNHRCTEFVGMGWEGRILPVRISGGFGHHKEPHADSVGFGWSLSGFVLGFVLKPAPGH